jgi:hypothetical protein
MLSEELKKIRMVLHLTLNVASLNVNPKFSWLYCDTAHETTSILKCHGDPLKATYENLYPMTKDTTEKARNDCSSLRVAARRWTPMLGQPEIKISSKPAY